VDARKIIGNSRKLKFGGTGGTATQVGSGMAFPVADLIQTFKPEVWEDFTEEWAYSQQKKYAEIVRYTGAGDMGLDILCFETTKNFEGPWDNVQCKRYACELKPTQVWVELGKIIYYSFIGEYPPPRNYYFAASKGLGLKLKKLLTKPPELKAKLIENWDGYCKKKITDTKEIPLEGALLAYLGKFDFSIFKMIPVAQMIRDHANTVFYARRFGTASFPERPPIVPPPNEVQAGESRYVKQLFEAYSERLAVQLSDPSHLTKYPEMEEHFNRSREVFYHAESLRNFPRDSVDPGAFDAIREEIYHGCVDVYDMDYKDGLTRIRSTVSHAGILSPSCNALCIRVQTQDKQGLCHHLANEGKFIWVKKNA
jgi:ABC-3C protein